MRTLLPDEAVAPKGAELVQLADRLRGELDANGVAMAEEFLSPAGLEALKAESEQLAAGTYRSVRKPTGTVYVEAPDPAFPPGHPRRRSGGGASLGIVAYDQLGEGSSLRALYCWEGLSKLVAEALGVAVVYPYADPLGAVNVTYMGKGDHLGWHFDQTDFVVSLALSATEEGGELESANRVRSSSDECYEEVASVLDGTAAGRVSSYRIVPGSLMLFQGRHSLHRVHEVSGDTVRCVALLGYDTRPGVRSTEQLRLARYGRVGD